MENDVRIDSVNVQVIFTQYDKEGRPISEQVSNPIKMFRAKSEDFWAEVDKLINRNG